MKRARSTGGLLLATGLLGVGAFGAAPLPRTGEERAVPLSSSASNWYAASFYLLHLDYHTTAPMEVGRDADPAETARLLGLSRPDVIQIHAKGNPGWTTYPTRIGHAPPRLSNDVMRVWAGIARDQGYRFSAYYNIGRDGEIMKRHPAWNRIKANGSPVERALCYHSGVAEGYLWPMIDEIIDRYRPDGFWFDGSCFTVANCYCAKCRARFAKAQNLEPPKNPRQPGWAEFKEMQRQVYREFVAATATRIKQRDPRCLVAVNWAYALRMPEEPPPGLDYFTGDHGCQVDELSPDAIWYDSQGRPFDLMTTIFYRDAKTSHPKPRAQLEQEMAIIVAHGGRYFAWDNPTPESALVPERHELLGKVVAPFLRARQKFCLGSRRLPDISLFHGATAHYALSAASPLMFPRQNPPLLAASEGLRRLHLNHEMISDRRLDLLDIRSPLLLVEDPAALSDANVQALRRYVEKGGKLLLTGRATTNAQFGLPTIEEASESVPVAQRELGQGKMFYSPLPLFGKDRALSPERRNFILKHVLPESERLVTTDAPPTVELVLREKASAQVLHLVNLASGKRLRDPQANSFVSLRITDIPPAPPCRVSLKLPARPKSVMLQPQALKLRDWEWEEGRLNCRVPAFGIHQLVVIQ